MDNSNKLTLYIMSEVNSMAKQVKAIVGAKGIGEMLSNMLRYYAYAGGEPDYNMIEQVYTGRVHATNSKIHRLKVTLTDADLHTINKLTVLWGVPSISKVANYILWSVAQLDPGEYATIVRQVAYEVPGYSTWVKVETLLTEPQVLNGYETLLAQRIAENPLLSKAQEGVSLPQGLVDTQTAITQDKLLKEIIEAGIKALMQ